MATEGEVRRLLVYLGCAMVACGQTVGDVEDEVVEVAGILGFGQTQIAASPTGVTLSLGTGEPATFESIKGPLRLDQAVDVRDIRYGLARGRLSVDDATAQLASLRDRPPRYPRWAGDLGIVVISLGIALVLQPGRANIAFAALGGLVVAGLVRLARRFGLVATLLPTLAAGLLGCAVFAAANAGLLEGPLRTLLAPLAVLLPGALLVTAMSELAAGDMMSGSARLIYGVVQLMLFTLGVVAASRLLRVPDAQLTNLRVDELGWWTAPVGIVLIVCGLLLAESPPVRLLPWIAAVLTLAFVAQTLGQQVSAALGSFLGALAASLGAYLVEAIKPSLPRLVVFLPAFWLLVPGSLGLLSTTQVVLEPSQALASVISVVGVISALALGLLVGSAVAQAVRRLRRRGRRDRRAEV